MDPDQLASLEGSQPTFTSKKNLFDEMDIA